MVDDTKRAKKENFTPIKGKGREEKLLHIHRFKVRPGSSIMCMPTSSSRAKLAERKAPQTLLSKSDRLGISPFVKYARGFTLAVMVAAYVGRQTQEGSAHLTSLMAGVAEKSSLSSSWVFLYFLLVWVVVKKNWRRFLHFFQELTGFTHRGTEEDSLLERVSSSEAISKIRSSMRLFSASHANLLSEEGRHQAISGKDSFLEKSIIADLTLGDVKELFSYSIECNISGFTRPSFASRLRPAARKAIDAIDTTVQASRGPDVKQSKASDSWDYGEVDALVFMAVVRVFAEWRNLRLVPDGFQRYAVGMNLARRDLVQNINKMETAAHAWLTYYESTKSSQGDLNMASPTLRELLQHEIDRKIHTRLPRLRDHSAASGFLWTNRQLHYQTAIFSNTMEVPILFPTSKAALTAAYKQVYDDYHGFFVKAIFQNSFEAAPDPEVVFHFMSLPSLSDNDDLTVPSSVEEEDECGSWVQCPVDTEPLPPHHKDWNAKLEDNPHEQFGDHNPAEPSSDEKYDEFDSWVQFPVDTEPLIYREIWTEDLEKNPLEQFGDHLLSELDKMGRFWDQCRGVNMTQHPSRNVFHVGSMHTTPISTEAAKASQDDIPSYMNILQPFLLGLDGLIEEMDINDPTKV
jgi:hypothetical protein